MSYQRMRSTLGEKESNKDFKFKKVVWKRRHQLRQCWIQSHWYALCAKLVAAIVIGEMVSTIISVKHVEKLMWIPGIMAGHAETCPLELEHTSKNTHSHLDLQQQQSSHSKTHLQDQLLRQYGFKIHMPFYIDTASLRSFLLT